MTLVRCSRSEAETVELAERLGRRLGGGDVVCLDGPLGAGKTRFVAGLAAGLGHDPREVSSPTFVICRLHRAAGRPTLAHVDAFRLGGAEELESIGWEELVGSPTVIVAVEWPTRIAAALPTRRIDVTLEHTGEHTRRISIRAAPDLEDRLEGIV